MASSSDTSAGTGPPTVTPPQSAVAPPADTPDTTPHGLPPLATSSSLHSPRFGFLPTAPRSTSVNNHRAISATLPLTPIRHGSVNLFIPCFAMMYYIIDAMNDKVCSLRPYSDSGPANDWIPHISVIFFSILAIIQTFRAQRLIQALDPEQSRLLDFFLDKFPLETLTIPGPLVPFFRSLSVSDPRIGDYQKVSPAIPPFSYREESMYALRYVPPGTEQPFPGITMMIPNIPLMLNQFRQLLEFLVSNDAGGQPNRYTAYTQLSNIFGYPAPALNGANRALYDHITRSIGFWHRPTASNGLMARFAQHYNNVTTFFPASWTFTATHAADPGNPNAVPPAPARAAEWITYSDIFNSLGFDIDTEWFHSFNLGMPTFLQHFKGNVRLIDIPPITSSASMIRFKEVSIDPIPAEALFARTTLNKASHRLNFNTFAITPCSDISSEDFQDAQMAQINITCPTPFYPDNCIGDIGITHFGDFWQDLPDVLKTNRGNLAAPLKSIVCSPSYFQEHS